MKNVKEDIKKLNEVATIPVIVQRLQETIGDEKASHVELSEIIEHDQSIAEKVVAMANSSYFGHLGVINNLEQAVLLLGFDLVKSIAMSIAVFEALLKKEADQMKKFWAHCYEVASISGLLCKKIPAAESGICFLAGLLHDIGKVVFYSLYPEDYKSIMFSEESLTKEKELFDISHATAGSWFLENAKIPEEIVLSVRHHHDIKGCERHKGIALTVYLAESVSSLIFPGKENDGVWDEEHEKQFHDSGLNKEDLEQIEAFLKEESPSITEFFGL